MSEHRISQNELCAEEAKLANLERAGLPFRGVFALALGAVLSAKGIRFRHTSVNPCELPQVLPPFEMWRDPASMDLVIRQGAAARG